MLRGPRFDLVLSDVVLPGGTNGPEFIEETLKNHPDLKVLFMSGYPAQSGEGPRVMGVHGRLLSKPFKLEQLASALSEALD